MEADTIPFDDANYVVTNKKNKISKNATIKGKLSHRQAQGISVRSL
jgi:hypothetical protein